MSPFTRKFILFSIAYIACAQAITLWILSVSNFTVSLPSSLQTDGNLDSRAAHLVVESPTDTVPSHRI